MAQEKEVTFEEVNQHFEKVQSELSELQEGGKDFQAVGTRGINPAEALKSACKGYKIIKPFLSLVLGIPFIPNNWKNAIKTFVNLMNGVCP